MSVFPLPELTLDVAARTTEHAGARAAIGAISCDWTLAKLGPWRAEIPTPIVPIPVYADVPLQATAHVGASLAAFQINLASTHNLEMKLGHSDHVELSEQGSNVWTSGTLGWTGDAELGLSLGLELGLGDRAAGNFHVEAAVRAKAGLLADHACELELDPGSFSAGIKIGPFSASTTLWQAPPFRRSCGPVPGSGAAPGGATPGTGAAGGGSGGGGGPPPASVTLDNPGGQVSQLGTAVAVQLHASDTGAGTLSYSASGLPPGVSIDQTTGLIAGTPTATGSYTAAVVAKDAGGASAEQQFGWSVLPAGAKATSVSAGNNSCALLQAGGVDCWGENEFGELGDGAKGPSPACDGIACSTVPVPVKGITDATQVSAGSEFACAVLSGGTVQCWGNDDAGQLGHGTNTGPEQCDGEAEPCSDNPLEVSGITSAVEVAVGGQFACARLSNGNVECWGDNVAGQLGDGTTEGDGQETSIDSCGEYQCSATPVAVVGISDAANIDAGVDTACAVLSGGKVKCWGDNVFGQLGNGTETGSATPVFANGITTATQVSVGGDGATCALLTGDAIECWGDNAYGELGNGDNTGPHMCDGQAEPCSTTPVAVSGISTATQVSASPHYTCATLTGGEINCWGDNTLGELGNGGDTGPDNCWAGSPCTSTPELVPGISDAAKVSAGGGITCATLDSGGIDCWGTYLLGDGTRAPRYEPTPVSGFG